MSKVLKEECQNGEIGIGPLCPHGMYSVLPNLKIFFYVHPWNEFYSLVIHKSLILTFLPKNYLLRVPSLHRISSVIWTGIAAYRTLCTSQVICKQNTTSRILSMDLKFCITIPGCFNNYRNRAYLGPYQIFDKWNVTLKLVIFHNN